MVTLTEAKLCSNTLIRSTLFERGSLPARFIVVATQSHQMYT